MDDALVERTRPYSSPEAGAMKLALPGFMIL